MTASRSALPSLVLAHLMLGGGPASAAPPTKKACFEASTEGQKLALAGKLREAKVPLATCSDKACPKEVAQDCKEQLAAVEKRFGSILTTLTGADGKPVVDGRVLLDGVPVADSLGGAAIIVEPGKHNVRVEPKGGPALDREVVIADGAKDVIVAFVVAPPPAPAPAPVPAPAAPPARGVPTMTWVAGAVGAAGLLSFAGLGLSALSQSAGLHARAPGTYSERDVNVLKTKIVLADVSLGVGLVGASVAAYFYLHADAPTDKAGAIDVQPLPGGAAFTWSGRF